MSAIPTSATTWAHVNTRSPFFVDFDTTEEAATLELKVWIGDRVTNFPANPQYTMVKRAVDGKCVFEVAEMVRDYISQTTTLNSGCVWFQTDITDGTNTAVVDYVADEGYLIYSESIQNKDNVSDDTEICLVGGSGEKRVLVPNGGSSVIGWKPQALNTFQFYAEKYNASGTLLSTTNASYNDLASSRMQYITVTNNVAYVDFYWAGSNTERVYVDSMDCRKYDVIDLLFVNKFGAKQYFPFQLKSEERLSVQDKNHKASTMNYSTLSSTQGLHVNNRYLTDVKQTFNLNTDYLTEYYVQQFEQLLLSENVWMRKGGVLQPVVISTKRMTRKSHVNDGLIQYSIDVELARNYLNDLR